MKQPYKVQNRTTSSRRVKFVKNGGTVSFPKTPTASFVENSREAGFCLTAITPLPDRDNATNTITLTSHPMGTDGRVSLFINGSLIESKRFASLGRIPDRQAWFNREFGAYVTYTGKEQATFTSAIVSQDVYRFVFEDDDIDFIFADTTNAVGDVNPTLIVEQYRLAFNIMNNKIEISCDGAEFETPYMVLEGDWQLEINGEKYTTETTPIEEMLLMIAASDVEVVYEGEAPAPEPVEKVINDYTLFGWYNPELKQYEGIARPGQKMLAFNYNVAEGERTNMGVVGTSGRWSYPVVETTTAEILNYEFYIWVGDDFNDEDTIAHTSGWWPTSENDLVVPVDDGSSMQVLPSFGKIFNPNTLRDISIHYRIGDGEIQTAVMSEYKDYVSGEDVSAADLIAFMSIGGVDGYFKPESARGPFGKFMTQYTNVLDVMENYVRYGEGKFIDVAFLGARPDRIPLDEPVTITFYRGLTNGANDLFDLLFKGTIDNYLTFTATHRIDPNHYIKPAGQAGMAGGKFIQTVSSPDGDGFLIWDTTDIDNISYTKKSFQELIPDSVSTWAGYNLPDYQNFFKLHSGKEQLIASFNLRSEDPGYDYYIALNPTDNFSLTAVARDYQELMNTPIISDDVFSYSTSWGTYFNKLNTTDYELPMYERWSNVGHDQVSQTLMVRDNEYIMSYTYYDQSTSTYKYYLGRVALTNGITDVYPFNEVTVSTNGGEWYNLQGQPAETVQLNDTMFIGNLKGCLSLLTVPVDITAAPSLQQISEYANKYSCIKVGETTEEVFVYMTDYLGNLSTVVAFNRVDGTYREVTRRDGSTGNNYQPLRDNLFITWWTGGSRAIIYRFNLETEELEIVPYVYIGEKVKQ